MYLYILIISSYDHTAKYILWLSPPWLYSQHTETYAPAQAVLWFGAEWFWILLIHYPGVTSLAFGHLYNVLMTRGGSSSDNIFHSAVFQISQSYQWYYL